MGLFNFGGGSSNTQSTSTPITSTAPAQEVAPTGGILNLQKNQFLDLNKAQVNLGNMRLAAGWDVSRGRGNYDLDICAILCDANGRYIDKVYYGAKNNHGVRLDGDNLTGAGDGDDENIYVNVSQLRPNVKRIVTAVCIYSARARGQSFKYVENAYVRLVDESTGKEVCRYNLSGEGGDASAVIFAELFEENGSWNFKAIGEACNASIDDIARRYK